MEPNQTVERAETKPEKLAYTIATFCDAAEISPSYFFKLQKEGRGPRTVRLGTKVLITAHAARDWFAELERETD